MPRRTRGKSKKQTHFSALVRSELPIFEGLACIKRGRFHAELFCFYPMLANTFCAAFFRVLESKGWSQFLTWKPFRREAPKDVCLAQVSLGRGTRCRQQASRAHDRHGVCWKKIEPAIVDSIVKQRCGRISDVGGKAEDIYSWRVFRSLPSRPREFHPEPLTDPDLILSHHPARAID